MLILIPCAKYDINVAIFLWTGNYLLNRTRLTITKEEGDAPNENIGSVLTASVMSTLRMKALLLFCWNKKLYTTENGWLNTLYHETTKMDLCKADMVRIRTVAAKYMRTEWSL